ncbi:MAG: Helix-turn-helix domain [Halanaerobiales bacterium]|nr:Helix-turn-helix domain [Halanaerobiales bacterium]
MENKLKELRINSNKVEYQEDVVRELKKRGVNITSAYYSMIEGGKRTPNPRIMKALADIFDTTIEDIFFNKTTNVSLENSPDQKPA